MAGPRHPVVILAGGKSTRLGRDKASEPLAGKPMVQHVIDATAGIASALVIVIARGQTLPEVQSAAPMSIVEDEYPDTGPLGGIYTGLKSVSGAQGEATTQPDPQIRANLRESVAKAPTALVVACDLPLLQPALLEAILRLARGHDAAAPVREGLPEPLCAAYTTDCLEPARELLEGRSYKVSALLEKIDARLVPETHWRPFDPEGLSFLNVNREIDLERAKELLSGRRTRPGANPST